MEKHPEITLREKMQPKSQNHYYNPLLKNNARTLRYSMTKAQASLWKYVLRAEYMRGYTFKRERPVLKYITDFMCQELQLIIEVDGITHTWEETMEKDALKDKALESIGFKVLRFTDQEVLRCIDDVKAKISDTIDEILEERGGR